MLQKCWLLMWPLVSRLDLRSLPSSKSRPCLGSQFDLESQFDLGSRPNLGSQPGVKTMQELHRSQEADERWAERNEMKWYLPLMMKRITQWLHEPGVPELPGVPGWPGSPGWPSLPRGPGSPDGPWFATPPAIKRIYFEFKCKLKDTCWLARLARWSFRSGGSYKRNDIDKKCILYRS